MKCPRCDSIDTKVLDTRAQKNGETTRRRRECEKCSMRFTTVETLVRNLPMVIKKDGRREPFSPSKLLSGLKAACQKRPIGLARLEQMVEVLTQWVLDCGEKEIASQVIGHAVMNELKELDEVAYVRFASVYKTFRDVNEFVADLSPESELQV